MLKRIELNGKTIEYNFQYKNVKNINLRIKSDKTIHVSANRNISEYAIEEFLKEKSFFILKALEKFSQKQEKPLVQYRTEAELKSMIISFCRKVHPYYEGFKIPFPEIRFKKMISRWGSCHPTKKVLTFNLNLIYAPDECVEYVVWHEFTHFLQPNHSKKFYAELSAVCPKWHECRRMLKNICIKS